MPVLLPSPLLYTVKNTYRYTRIIPALTCNNYNDEERKKTLKWTQRHFELQRNRFPAKYKNKRKGRLFLPAKSNCFPAKHQNKENDRFPPKTNIKNKQKKIKNNNNKTRYEQCVGRHVPTPKYYEVYRPPTQVPRLCWGFSFFRLHSSILAFFFCTRLISFVYVERRVFWDNEADLCLREYAFLKGMNHLQHKVNFDSFSSYLSLYSAHLSFLCLPLSTI